jgi:DNA polymerase III subunit delta
VKANLTHYVKIFKDVDRREIVNLYLLHGPESYIMEKMADRIASTIVPGDLKAFNHTVAYGSEMKNVDEFIATASSFPFLSESRVLVFRELEKLRGSWKKLVAYCENPAPSSVVIFLYNPYDEGKGRARESKEFEKLLSAVSRTGKAIEFERLTDADVRKWVVQEAKNAGVELGAEAADALVLSVGDDLFDLKNEIVKLSLLYGDRRVDVADLAGVIGGYRLNAVRDLVESMVPGREGRALAVLHRIVRSGAERPAGIIYQLTRHFLDLLKASEGVGQGGYRFDRSKREARAIGPRAIVVWLENLRRAELLLKTSSFPEEALLVGVFLHSFKGSYVEFPLMAA